jgi:hypothetical protein
MVRTYCNTSLSQKRREIQALRNYHMVVGVVSMKTSRFSTVPTRQRCLQRGYVPFGTNGTRVRTMVRTMVLEYVHVYKPWYSSTTRVRTYVRTYTGVRTYNVMSQLSDWKRAHMCTENHVCTYEWYVHVTYVYKIVT